MTTTSKTVLIEVNIPAELKLYRQWVVWRYEVRDKPTKVPYQADGLQASSTDASTWSNFETIYNAYLDGGYDGIGFVVTPTDKFCGVDLDHCRNSETGEIEQWARDIVNNLNSYTEITPSMEGIRVWLKGKIPPGGNRKGKIEIYEQGRYFTITGRHLEGTRTTIEERQQELNHLHASIFPPVQKANGGNGHHSPVDLADTELIQKAMAAANGAAFLRLWQGDTSSYDGDDSRADLALCSMLAFWTGNNANRIDSLFRQSKLYREKWERQDYREGTIKKAVEGNHETYEPGYQENRTQNENAGLPEISITGRNLRDITTDALEALYKANNPPTVFIRSGVLSRLGIDEINRPYIETMSESAVRGYLARACNFTRTNEKNQVAIAPPLDVVRDFMSRGTWAIPPLAGIIQTPALRPDGSIISEPGYDKTTALYYVPSDGLEVPVIPDKPSGEDVKKAVTLITEVFCDIPFDSLASKANAYGAFISPVLRPAIKGTMPLPLVDKPMPGTGASLLTDIISIVATGHMAATMGVCQSEEEWEKKLSSHLIAGRSICVIDNIEGKLQSDTLSRYLTSSEISIRPLGRTADIIVPNKMSFFATGINIKLGGDIPRRCYHIRLDAGVARPWQRDILYKHPELRELALNNRGQILGAILTVARAWYVAGKPIPKDLPKMGGFENYSRVIGGILSFIKMTGFLSNLAQMYDSMDVDTPQWEAFLTAWYELIEDTPVTVAEVVKHLNENEEFADSLPEKLATRDGRDYSRRLGNALRSKDNVQLPCELTLNRDGERKHAILWKVSYKKANSPNSPLASKDGELATERLVFKCPCCGSEESWHRADGGTVCCTCHPPVDD